MIKIKYINIDNQGKINNEEPYSIEESTSLQGMIDVDYLTLVKVFGKQNSIGDKYKVDAQWIIHTPEGIATIYNYKDGRNYNGKNGLLIKDLTDWHIGGTNLSVVEWINKALRII